MSSNMNIVKSAADMDADLSGRGGGGWDFREYMQIKKQKLKAQNREEADIKSDIFHGVNIYINGYTDPPAEDLRRLIIDHGGDTEVYFRRRRVTHMVASNLCGAKIKELREIKVVLPTWITDSIAQGKKLPIGPYLLYHREGFDQSRLTFAPKSQASPSNRIRKATDNGQAMDVQDGNRAKADNGQTQADDDKDDNDNAPHTDADRSDNHDTASVHLQLQPASATVSPASIITIPSRRQSMDLFDSPHRDSSELLRILRSNSQSLAESQSETKPLDHVDESSNVKRNSLAGPDFHAVDEDDKLDKPRRTPRQVKVSTKGVKVPVLSTALAPILEETGDPILQSSDTPLKPVTEARDSGMSEGARDLRKDQTETSSALQPCTPSKPVVVNPEVPSPELLEDLPPLTRLPSKRKRQVSPLKSSTDATDSTSSRMQSIAAQVLPLPEQVTSIPTANNVTDTIEEPADAEAHQQPSERQASEQQIDKQALHTDTDQEPSAPPPAKGGSESGANQRDDQDSASTRDNDLAAPGQGDQQQEAHTMTKASDTGNTIESKLGKSDADTIASLGSPLQAPSPLKATKLDDSLSLPAAPTNISTAKPVSDKTSSKAYMNASIKPSYRSYYDNLDADEKPGAQPDIDKYGPLVSGNNPDFINQYYSQSRLHLLSVSGNEVKAFVRQMQKDATARGVKIKDFSAHDALGRVIVHIDLDAFFCSVGLRDRPELVDKPVAVAHSKTGGSSEISSCNYIARKHGIRNGTSTRRALDRCPELQIIPYEFAKYKAASQEFYKILTEHTLRIQAMSMDEAYLDLTGDVRPDYDVRALHKAQEAVTTAAGMQAKAELSPAALHEVMDLPQSASDMIAAIREQVQQRIGITASAGIAPTILLARMCTRKAKPNGQYSYNDVNPERFVDTADVSALPGVGWSTGARLKAMGITQCDQLRKLSLAQLQGEFGERNGEALFQACRGLDLGVLKGNMPPKSVSVEISWGVRFATQVQVEEFVQNLAKEVTTRLKGVSRKGKRITLKIKQKKPDVGAPYKMLGHGPCDDRNRTATLPRASDDVQIVTAACLAMCKHINVPAIDVRGVGISIHQLVDADEEQGSEPRKVTSFFKQADKGPTATSGTANSKVKPSVSSMDLGKRSSTKASKRTGKRVHKQAKLDSLATKTQPANASMEKVDPDVLAALPAALRKEVERQYKVANKGKAKRKQAEANRSSTSKATDAPSTLATSSTAAAASKPKLKTPSPKIAPPADDFISPSQWDQGFLAELPPDVVQQMKAEAMQLKARRAAQQREVEKTEELIRREGLRPSNQNRASKAPKLTTVTEHDDHDDPDDADDDARMRPPSTKAFQAPALPQPSVSRASKLTAATTSSLGGTVSMPELGPASPPHNRTPPRQSPKSASKRAKRSRSIVANTAPSPASKQSKRLVMPHHADGVVAVTVTGLPHLMGCTDLSTMTAIVTDWVRNNYTGATPDKVAALETLIVGLCQHKRLDALLSLLKTMKRHVMRSPSVWQQCYEQLLQQANQHLQTLFSIKLPL
eukprot:TRINITY_DN11522_c0_g1_i2.p1 TRINITY_DN11522_c0_g1~~TRINITY_DN11522_c0_g1_i2.p1  ORF type:complete len:1535 (+),score=413.85 TRINITY_DN11522_c0_g1_i2:84-4688(+)